jgi:RNA polymerase sigma factor (sigma-70 family)
MFALGGPRRSSGNHSAAMPTLNSDRDRFSRMVLPHLADAHTLARWITGSGIDAEDVVQDACLRAYLAIGDTAVASPRNWLLTLVRSCAYTWLRKNRPAAVVAVDDLEQDEYEQIASRELDPNTPETALIAKVSAEHIGAAIFALPAPFREMLVLRDIQGLAYCEIAQVTGVPIGTVMSRLARGRNRVIKAIGRKKP